MIGIAAIALTVAATPQPGQAEAALAAGRFAEAARVGRTAPDLAGRIAGGRAASTLAAYQASDKAQARALLEQAEADFAAALKQHPDSQEALLQKAIVIGYRAKLANSRGLAKQAREGIEAAIALNPRDPLALAALGGWHGETVATLGRLVAGAALGAKTAESLRLFEQAMAQKPRGPAVPTFYAFTLLALSADHADRARALLAGAQRASPADGFDQILLRNGREVLALLEKGDVAAARAAAKRRSPLGAIP